MPRVSDLAGVLLDSQTGYRWEVHFGTPAWEATLEWCRFHGLDPCSILAGSTIIRDDRSHVIAYTAVVRGSDGQIVVDASGHVLLEDCIERGEAGPLPFPVEVTGGES